MTERRDLDRVDRALLDLRRVWDAPAGIDHEGVVVDGSTLLVCLAVSERAGQGRNCDVGVSAVAEVLGVTHSTASRLVVRAADAGMLDRNRSLSDPRRAALTLTAAGSRLVDASREFRRTVLSGLLQGWSDSDVATLADLLTRFAAAVRRPQGPPT